MQLPDPLSTAGLLLVLGLLPFIAMMCSSFVKIVVVANLIRNALGIQQIPPNMALNGLALILTLYVMAPVVQDTHKLVKDSGLALSDFSQLGDAVDAGQAPLKGFLMKHSTQRERAFFYRSAFLLWGKERADELDKESFFVLIPAFMVTELTKAFQIGFLLYLPFIAIDLIISNILMAMGMMMVSPMTISLPFKLMLFVMLNGWSSLLQGLILSYK